MLQRIMHGDKLLAIIIKSDFEREGIEFFTPDNFSQQLAYMNRPKGYAIAPHVHNTVIREIKFTNEVLFIKSGKIRIDFYDDRRDYIESRILETGDVMLIASAGHGIEAIENSKIIEVKQGPYVKESDKVRFEAIDKGKLKIRS